MENGSVIRMMPTPYSQEDAQRNFQKWAERAADPKNAPLAAWMASIDAHHATAAAIFGTSPYLTRLLQHHPAVLHDIEIHGADRAWDNLLQELEAGEYQDTAGLMRHLRLIKGRAALLIALADIAGTWPVPQVTEALSALAERALQLAFDFLLAAAQKRGEVELAGSSGIIILGMGKLGGHELNYSSDIDLIVFFEPKRIAFKGRLSEQQFMTKLCHDLVTILQERTPEGYVFRTDLRLRPDPASTPPAISTEAAYYYYESVGQNWERAAMIKARPVAGDIAAGERFLKGIAPFMWRRNLDFAAIADIHSIKRQMDSHQNRTIEIRGHNIKLGHGGIREIEFFAQIHQLIWGGREPVLRTRGTLETLARLCQYGLIDAQKEQELRDAYLYLRTLEHRLQMIDDAQTHSLPETDESLACVACFMGYANTDSFENAVLPLLTRTHHIYASSFKNEAQHLGGEGRLVFTGPTHDPETLATLRAMGYAHPETVSEIVMGWHHGSRRATRSKRARELLTEMMPLLLKRLSETANADQAFLKFNEFLINLPSGVQLFSLFNANPQLLGLIADIMGSAPTLAVSLSRTPELLEAVLYEDFNRALPSHAQLEQQLSGLLADRPSIEAGMDRIRNFRNEKQFQAGIQLLKSKIDAETSGAFLSDLADVVIARSFELVQGEFVKTYGDIEGSSFAVIALGKLGSREMTFSSDIDLVFVYDNPDFDKRSDGEKNHVGSVYFNRLAQRFVGALSAMGRTGRLYEVDTRLRPSGKQGLLAVSTGAIRHYFDELAWTFEYMAFTKARVIIAPPPLREALDHFIYRQLVKPRDAQKLKTDAYDMRERIAKERPASGIWSVKYARGGLMDIDFIAQYLMLLHAPVSPSARPGSALDAFEWLRREGRIDPEAAQSLIDSAKFLVNIFNILRLCSDGNFDEDAAPPGLKKLLVQSVREKDFESARARLIQVEQSVFERYIGFLKNQAPEDI